MTLSARGRLVPFVLALLMAPSVALPAAAGTGRRLASAGAAVVREGSSAVQPGAVNRSSMKLRATYDVRLSLRYDAATLSATSAMVVANTSGVSIDRLELNSAAARLGRLRISSASVDGRAVGPRISDQTILLPLGGVLPAGASTTVRLAFTASFPGSILGSGWLFSRANGIIDAYRWLPWISRVTPFDRPNFGDPFVTPVSPRVRVVITTDRPMGIATGAARLSHAGLTQTFQAENVRDFNFTASPYYSVLTSSVGDTRLQVFFRTGASASTLVSWAKRAIGRYEALVGPYPYPVFRVGESAGGYGMESPGLIWIPYRLAASRVPYLVSHEVGHQWFYAAVGNDQASEPFADEALTDFLARYTLGLRRASSCATARLDLTISSYSSACYYEVIYIQGGNYLDDLRRRIGSTAFWSAIRDYYASYRFRLAGTRSLLTIIDAHTPLDLRPTYHPRFPRYF